MKQSKVMIGIFTAAALFGGTAWVSANSNEASETVSLSSQLGSTESEEEAVDNQPETEQEVNVQEADEPATQEFISIEEAQTIAIAEQDGFVESIELDLNSGKEYYEVEIEQGNMEYEIEIDAYSGEVLRIEEDDDGDNDHVQSGLLVTDDILSVQEILEQLEGQVEGALVELQLDREDNIVIYELEFETDQGMETEVEVNAVTGDILEIDVD